MIYLIAFASFCLGFSVCALLILRVSMRPKAKKVLKKAGLLKEYKAVVPNRERVLEL